MRKRARGKTPPLSPYARPQPRPDGVAAIAESSWVGLKFTVQG